MHLIDFQHKTNKRVRLEAATTTTAKTVTAIGFHRQLANVLLLGDRDGRVSLFDYGTFGML